MPCEDDDATVVELCQQDARRRLNATVRRQLSLYLPYPARELVDRVRARVDPIQHRLIPAHVTLCRDDEVALAEPFEKLRRSLAGLSVSLRFSGPERFQGHGIMLRAVADSGDFYELRRRILGPGTGNVGSARRLDPHVTLAHPRNPRAPGNSLENAAALAEGLSVRFEDLCLVEQRGSAPWRVLHRLESA